MAVESGVALLTVTLNETVAVAPGASVPRLPVTPEPCEPVIVPWE